MLARIHDGQYVEAVFGDVVFTVFKPNSIDKADFQHSAICNEDKVTITSPKDTVQVIEFTGNPRSNTWPSGDFEIHLIGKMYIDGNYIDESIRLRIINTARRLNRRYANTINNLGALDCRYSFENYKCVKPDYNNPNTANFIRFTCAGFVEYCYEQAMVDIVNDGIDGSLLPVVVHPGDADRNINRLFPGYQIKAFMYDSYPLDFNFIRRLNQDPKDYQYYPFSISIK